MPGLIKGAMTLPVGPGRKVIDEAHVPLCIGRNSVVAPATVIVDACDHPMEAVLEACVHGINMRSRDQRIIEEVRAFVGPEEPRRGLLRSRHQSHGLSNGLKEIAGQLASI